MAKIIRLHNYLWGMHPSQPFTPNGTPAMPLPLMGTQPCLYPLWEPMQGLFIPIACVGSGDPVRVLRLYTKNTLDTL